MSAVAAASAVLVMPRLPRQCATGRPSPRWCNELGLIWVPTPYGWYRGGAEQRVGWAIPGTAAFATLALLALCRAFDALLTRTFRLVELRRVPLSLAPHLHGQRFEECGL